MRSLFAKIIVWFALALVATVTASVFISALSYNPYSTPRPAPFSMLLSLELANARHAWEQGGAVELRDQLERVRRATHASGAMLTDANGTDVLTGVNYSGLVKEAHSWYRYPFSGRGGTTFARFAPDGKYVLFLVVAPVHLINATFQRAHVLVVVLAVLLCYALAYHLTAPLRRLRKALDAFGRGDLSARAEEKRQDELGELAQSFNGMADHIQTLVAAEHRLLLDVSHELRSPLTRLSVAVELARSGEGNALPLDRIQKEADRLNALITQLLEVTRMEGDPSNRRMERIKLDQLVGELVEDCSIEARARGCALTLDPAPAIAVDGDGELLRRAIENVMRNAIRYAPRESRVEVAVSNGSGRARVRVRDYGPGVPEESLPRLFDPFYRVQPDRNRGAGGVGLGLSIARRAVELHHGTLVASNATPGLRVDIELPA